MVMVFTIVSAVQEKLTEIVELIADRKCEEKERCEREAEEAERVSKHLIVSGRLKIRPSIVNNSNHIQHISDFRTCISPD